MRRIYLDNAAATYLEPEVKKAMDDFSFKYFGNPSSIYEEGRMAKQAVEEARKKIAKIINALPEEIIFISSGTEGNNLTIFGAIGNYYKLAAHLHDRGKMSPRINHIIASKIEHPSVLNAVKELEKRGFGAAYLNVDRRGFVDFNELKNSLQKGTILVSIMLANHEIGTIQPIAEISEIIRKFNQENQANVLLHTDACQAGNYLNLDVKKLGVDLMTVNGSKIYGPKGTGFLFVRKGVNLRPILYGGEQEKRIRPGTENVSGIVGLGAAFDLAQKMRIKESKRLAILRDYFIKEAFNRIPGTVLNGDESGRLANNINLSIYGIEGEAAVLYLDSLGIACSTGSACTSSRLEPSHVISAIGLPYEFSHGSLRFSLGRKTTKQDLVYVLDKLEETVKILREISAVKFDKTILEKYYAKEIKK